MIEKPLVLLALLLASSSAYSQVGGLWDEHFKVVGSWANANAGTSVAGVSDLNGDGIPDVLVGAPYEKHAGTNSGSVYVHSGATGAFLYRIDGLGSGLFGWSVAGHGDVNGDSFGDILVGAPWATNTVPGEGSCFLYSGVDGSLIRRYDGQLISEELGYFVADAGDVDGDGVSDSIVGASGNWTLGSARVFSGATGGTILHFLGQFVDDKFGAAVDGAGDVDGDGVLDLIVGAYGSDTGNQNTGTAYVFSGANGLQIYRHFGVSAGFSHGRMVAGVGDVNSDGFDDYMVGAPGSNLGGLSNSGSVFIYGGRTGGKIARFDGPRSDELFSYSAIGPVDLEGDGELEVVIAAPHASPGGLAQAGTVYIYSWDSKSMRLQFDGRRSKSYFGTSISMAGDLLSKGVTGFAVGAIGEDPNGVTDAGSATVFVFDPFLTTSSSELSVSSGQSVVLAVNFPDTEASYAYVVLASGTGVAPTSLGGILVPLTMDPLLAKMSGGWLPSEIQNGRGILDSFGNASCMVVPSSRLAVGIGRPLFFAAVSSNLLFNQGRLSSIARALLIVP